MKEELKIYESPVVEVVLLYGTPQTDFIVASRDTGDEWDSEGW